MQCPAGQILGLPLQTPAMQVSFCVQAFWSSQATPSCAAGSSQVPVLASQVPTR